MPTTSNYQGINFSYSEFALDIERMGQLAHDFIADDARYVFEQCKNDLENIRNAAPQQTHTWSILTELPIKTRVSRGEYRNKEKSGNIPVYGELSFNWQIVNPDKGKSRQRFFHLTGIASTKVLVKTTEQDEVVAHWQFEAGDAQSPGCHFHSAVNQYVENGLFPEWLKVPRFPNFLFSPMDALEFLLGELFQLEWYRTVSEKSESRDAWGKSQKERLENVLKWQLRQVSEWETTPWMSLKKAKPALELICGK